METLIPSFELDNTARIYKENTKLPCEKQHYNHIWKYNSLRNGFNFMNY